MNKNKQYSEEEEIKEEQTAAEATEQEETAAAEETPSTDEAPAELSAEEKIEKLAWMGGTFLEKGNIEEPEHDVAEDDRQELRHSHRFERPGP